MLRFLWLLVVLRRHRRRWPIRSRPARRRRTSSRSDSRRWAGVTAPSRSPSSTPRTTSGTSTRAIPSIRAGASSTSPTRRIRAIVKFIPFETDDKSIITAQVTLHDNLMITSLNSFQAAKEPAAGNPVVGHFRSGKSQAGRLVDGRRHRRSPQFLSGRQVRLSLDQLSGF